jgi:hypothetical protein
MLSDGYIICHSELVYLEEPESMTCSICGDSFRSNSKCINGHYVCDACHQLEGVGYFEAFCKNSKSVNPIEIANIYHD